MTEETLGKRISAHRKRLGLTQEALAERLGVTAQAVSKWENDQSCPDIAMLPKLAEIFAVTIDELLGAERKAVQVPVQPEPMVEDQKVNCTNPAKRTAIGIALWLLLTGLVLLLTELGSPLLCRPSFWTSLSLTGLMVFGLLGVYPRFSLFRLSCGILGGYYLYTEVFRPTVLLNKELLIPILLVFLGLGLLQDAIRGKMLLVGHKNWKEMTMNHFSCEENRFFCRVGFGEAYRNIELLRLEGGTAEVEFGELSVDIHDCVHISDQCCIRLKCSFGSLTLYVPRQYRLQCTNKTAFGCVQEHGSANPDAQGVIRVECDVSFGEISINYI